MPRPGQMAMLAKPIISSGGASASPSVMAAGDMHFSATNVTLTGAEVASVVDLHDATNSLVAQSSSVRPAQPAADAALGGALSMTFSGDTLISNKAASFWTFLHDGSPGYEVFMIGVPTSISGDQSWMFSGYAPGIDHGQSGGNFYHVIQEGGGGAFVYAVPALGMVNGTATYVNHSFSSAAGWALRRRGTSVSTGTQLGPPTPGASSQTLAVGWDGSNRMTFRLASLLVFKRVLSSGDRTIVQSWIQSTFGIAP